MGLELLTIDNNILLMSSSWGACEYPWISAPSFHQFDSVHLDSGQANHEQQHKNYCSWFIHLDRCWIDDSQSLSTYLNLDKIICIKLIIYSASSWIACIYTLLLHSISLIYSHSRLCPAFALITKIKENLQTNPDSAYINDRRKVTLHGRILSPCINNFFMYYKIIHIWRNFACRILFIHGKVSYQFI